jgi:hypothetical protein
MKYKKGQGLDAPEVNDNLRLQRLSNIRFTCIGWIEALPLRFQVQRVTLTQSILVDVQPLDRNNGTPPPNFSRHGFSFFCQRAVHILGK